MDGVYAKITLKDHSDFARKFVKKSATFRRGAPEREGSRAF
jgi:hypothetical protein